MTDINLRDMEAISLRDMETAHLEAYENKLTALMWDGEYYKHGVIVLHELGAVAIELGLRKQWPSSIPS